MPNPLSKNAVFRQNRRLQTAFFLDQVFAYISKRKSGTTARDLMDHFGKTRGQVWGALRVLIDTRSVRSTPINDGTRGRPELKFFSNASRTKSP